MSSTIQKALEQNRENIERLLEAVGADYEIPHDPEKSAKAAAIFDPDTKSVDKSDIELSEGERVAWLFQENAKALEAAAEAASGGAERSVVTESSEMKAVKNALSGGQ